MRRRLPPANFQEMLLRTFGREMCETFLFPYNRKLWKRPLETLVPAGFTWNITPPDFDKVLRGALRGNDDFQAYNSSGWYPRPPHGSAVRGMEVLSRALARRAADLRLEHVVELIDLDRRLVIARHNDQQRRFRFRRGCLATLPLPRLIAMCQQAPEPLRRATRRLSCNRVLSVMLSVRGPRPSTRGHWRYYSDESVVFTRLIYMHEFDPATAPDDGWGLLVELVEPAERPPVPRDEVFNRVRSDVRKVGALPDGCEIIDTHLMLVDPAYVVFTVDNQATVESANEFLAEGGITTLGRYGRWEYSSMSQVMRDAFCWADEQLAASAQTIMI